MIKKYRKKPVVIEAIKWEGDNFEQIKVFMDEYNKHNVKLAEVSQTLHIQTLEGVMIADVGNWIIKGIKGEFYPCKPDIFKETYEEVKLVCGDEVK